MSSSLGKLVGMSGKTIGFLQKHEGDIKKGVKVGKQVGNAFTKGGDVFENLADVVGEHTHPFVGQALKGINTLSKKDLEGRSGAGRRPVKSLPPKGGKKKYIVRKK